MSATRKQQTIFRELLKSKTINVGPVSYIKSRELAIISHATVTPVMEVAAVCLRQHLIDGFYDETTLVLLLEEYGYLCRNIKHNVVFTSTDFMWWRQRAKQLSDVWPYDTKAWSAGISRIVSKRIDTVVTPSVFTAA